MLSLEIEGKITGLLLIQRDRPVNGCALREQKVKTTNSKREKGSGSLFRNGGIGQCWQMTMLLSSAISRVRKLHALQAQECLSAL